MPAGQVGGGTGGPLDWFNELPKLTRSYAALLLFSAACISYGVSGIQYAVLDWNAIIRRFQVCALMRVTHACSLVSRVHDKRSVAVLFMSSVMCD